MNLNVKHADVHPIHMSRDYIWELFTCMLIHFYIKQNFTNNFIKCSLTDRNLFEKCFTHMQGK